MSNSSNESVYAEPNPTSALYMGIWFTIISTIAIPLNLFIITATVKVREILTIPSNAFIGSLALSDVLLMLCFALHLPYALSSNEMLCKVIGFGVSTFVVLGNWIPLFLALNRYAVICRQQDRLARFLFNVFSKRGTYAIVVLLWLFEITYQLPFAILDTLGLHTIGICTTTNMWSHDRFIRIYYYCGILGLFTISYIPLFIFYRKISLWITKMSARHSLSPDAKKKVRDTRGVLNLTKWVTIVPFLLSSPTVIIVILLEFNTELISMNITRLITSLYPLIPLLNAIITLKYARSYRMAFRKLCERTRVTATFFSGVIEGNWRFKADTVSDNNNTPGVSAGT